MEGEVAVEETSDHNKTMRCRRKVAVISVGGAILLGLLAWLLILVLGAEEETTAPITATTQPQNSAATNLEGTYELLETVPHDSTAFTQGFELIPNSQEYWESTGLYGQSSLRRVELNTGTVLQQIDVDSQYFAEGLTQLDAERLIQLTWKAGIAFVYDASTFQVLQQVAYENTNGEGWGICKADTGAVLYVTDGTHYLHTWDANTFELTGKVPVAILSESTESTSNATTSTSTTTLARTNVRNLNELEWDYHSQTVLANVWKEDRLVRIEPSTGRVVTQYDLSTLPRPLLGVDVLNGIAVTNEPNVIWVTGKLWPSLYKIRLVD